MAKDYDGLRSFIRDCQELGEFLEIDDADWNLEIGTLAETAAEHLDDPPAMLFDNIKGHDKGFRILSLPIGSKKRAALVLGLPPDKSILELVRLAATKIKNAPPIPPVYVEDGPVMENVMKGNEIDLWRFPSLFVHEHDGGRYIGTGDAVINKDPDSDFINLGTYRMQVQESNLLGIVMGNGQDAREICQRYWREGRNCPVVATLGSDPLLVIAGQTKYHWGKSELDYIGGLRGEGLPVIKGPLTGLPIPAHAEIAIEGEIPPFDQESRMEGPFGEYTGYYSSSGEGSLPELSTVIHVKAIYHRNDPIILNMSPQWPGAQDVGIRYAAGFVWNQLEEAGVPGVTGVFSYHPTFIVIAIKQSYPGHAKQVGRAATQCAGAHRNGRHVVVVDDDVDITKIKDVLFAIESRVEPATDIDIIENCWCGDADPLMAPDKRAARDYTNSRAIYDATRPYTWRDKFPIVNRANPEIARKVMDKYRGVLPFPTGD